MENGGWVKLHRSLLDSKFGRNLELMGIWAHLLLNAQWKDGFTPDGTPLKSGQLMTSYLSISTRFRVTESKVRRILLKLKNEEQIEVQSSTKNTIITILNWHKYQCDEEQTEERTKNERRTSEEQTKTYKKDNNIKNVKKDKNILSKDNIVIGELKESPLENLFESDDIKKWLRTGTYDLQVRIIETYKPEFLTREIYEAYWWQLENKKRKAGMFINSWLKKSATNNDMIGQSFNDKLLAIFMEDNQGME